LVTLAVSFFSGRIISWPCCADVMHKNYAFLRGIHKWRYPRGEGEWYPQKVTWGKYPVFSRGDLIFWTPIHKCLVLAEVTRGWWWSKNWKIGVTSFMDAPNGGENSNSSMKFTYVWKWGRYKIIPKSWQFKICKVNVEFLFLNKFWLDLERSEGKKFK